jgi:hypothetical protein
MKTFGAATTINASRETVWGILTDAQRYPEWDPGADRIEGTIAPGEKVVAYTKLNPKRAFPVKVTEFVPGERMTWTGGMPFGLFKGVRTFTLTPRGDGGTDVAVNEVFSGPLLPVFGGSLPDLNKTFAEFVAGLKARAEGIPPAQ